MRRVPTVLGMVLLACLASAAQAWGLGAEILAGPAVGDPVHCGTVRDAFTGADGANLGTDWFASTLQILGNRAAPRSSYGLATYTPTLPNPQAACVTVAAGEAKGWVSLGVESDHGLGRFVNFVDAREPFDGRFDTATLTTSYGGNTSGYEEQSKLLSPTLDSARVALRVTSHPDGSEQVEADVDGDRDGRFDLSFLRDVTFTRGTDTMVIASSGGATLDDFSTPSKYPGVGNLDGAAYTEQAASVLVAPDLRVADADSPALTGATVKIANPAAGDQLSYNGSGGGVITGSVEDGGATVRLTGSASISQYQTALRLVRYGSSSDNPAATKNVTFRVFDDGPGSALATQAITITPVNDRPELTASAGNAAYTENGAPVAVDPGLAVSDVDDVNLSGARVRVLSNLQTGDTLTFNAAGTVITGAYANGTLTLSGTASVSI